MYIDVFKITQKYSIFWATFERKLVTKKFQKSSNLVTLPSRSSQANFFYERFSESDRERR